MAARGRRLISNVVSAVNSRNTIGSTKVDFIASM